MHTSMKKCDEGKGAIPGGTILNRAFHNIFTCTEILTAVCMPGNVRKILMVFSKQLWALPPKSSVFEVAVRN